MRNKSLSTRALVGALDDVIVAAESACLRETAALLRIARLDLLMRVHGIEADEIEMLAFALVRASVGEAPQRLQKKPGSKEKSVKKPRPKPRRV